MSDKGFLYPGAYHDRQNVSVFEDGDGSWPVMTPLNPSPVYNIHDAPVVRMSWDSQTNEVEYTVLRTDEVQERVTAEEGE